MSLQLASAGAVGASRRTATHPGVARCLMTIPGARDLVVPAGAIGEDGQVMNLDMGEPVRIMDVARPPIGMCGKKIEIIFTGLRYGEKLREAVFSVNEWAASPHHPRISQASVQPSDPDCSEFDAWLEVARDEAALAEGKVGGLVASCPARSDLRR